MFKTSPFYYWFLQTLTELSNSVICLKYWKSVPADIVNFKLYGYFEFPCRQISASSLELALMVPEGSMQVSKWGKQQAVLPSHAIHEPQQWPAWHNNPKG